MSTSLRLALCSIFLLSSTALTAQNAPSTSEEEILRPTHEQGLALYRSVGLYSGAMMSNAYVGLVYADKGLQEGRNVDDIKMIVAQELTTLMRLEEQSSRLRLAFASEKGFRELMDTLLGGVTLLKAQGHALIEVINGKSRTEAGVDAKRQAARAYLLKLAGEKEDSKILP